MRLRGLDPVEPRHLHVHARRARARARGRARPPPRRRGPRRRPRARPLEQVAQVEPDDRLVLRDQDPHDPRFARVRRSGDGRRARDDHVTLRVPRSLGRAGQVRRQPPLRDRREREPRVRRSRAHEARGTYARHGSPHARHGSRGGDPWSTTAAGRFDRSRPRPRAQRGRSAGRATRRKRTDPFGVDHVIASALEAVPRCDRRILLHASARASSTVVAITKHERRASDSSGWSEQRRRTDELPARRPARSRYGEMLLLRAPRARRSVERRVRPPASPQQHEHVTTRAHSTRAPP